MANIDVAYREIDGTGRIVLPATWRKGMSKRLVLFKFENEIVIKEKKAGAFRKLRGALPAKPGADLDTLRAEGAADWKLE
ncbi:hypothetical protein HY995_01520 [Candidatus Micrarchaeota archaeon]|nr:hypothetical protein [Candidatus Micrarchaeota archaeon]MBI5176746.1 hypothetical protein [Candidatus Micrarchaeota archaeon]